MSVFKKLMMVLGTLVFLLLAAVVIIPLVVDVDKYRPQLVTKANEYLNGKLEIGKLSLSLWGQIRIQVDGVNLMDAKGTPVLTVKDAYFHLPFSSVLSGSPSLVFKMQLPVLHVIKDKAGKLNLLSLVKSSDAATPAKPDDAAKPAPSSSSMTLPGIATRARLGAEMLNARLTYQDERSGLDTQVNDLNLVVKDLSLTRTTEFELWADLDTKMGKTFLVKGPAKLSAKATPAVSAGHLDHLSLTAVLDLDGLEMSAPGLFEKRKGVATNADLAMTASEKEATIQSMNAKFFNAELHASGTVSNLSPITPGATADPVIGFALKSNDIALKPWVELIPMLKEYELDGSAHLDAEVKGPSSKLGYTAKLKVNGLTAKAPRLKVPPRFDGEVNVITDQIESLLLTMKAPGNELQVRGKMISFLAPHLDLDITSSGMDLDQLIDFPPPAAKGKPAAPAPGAPGAGTATPPASDYDALLNPLRENKMLAATVVNAGVNIKALSVYGIKMTDMLGKMTFRELGLEIPQYSMKLWNGTIKANASTQMKPKIPTYRFGTSVEGLDLAQAVASQLQLFKNTLLGKADFDMSAEGSSYNPEAAKKNLNAKGKLRVDHATFATIDVAKMAADAINQAITKIGDKVPAVRGKKVGGDLSRESRYEVISSDFTIAGGKFSAPNFVAKAMPDQGIDLKGSVTLGLIDYSLATNWEIIDTYNLTHGADLSADIAGTHVDHILAEKGQPLKFPVSAGCTALAPCYSYTQVPEHLAKVALGNLSGAAQGRVKAEIQKKIESVIPQSAPPAVQQGIQDLGKKLFGH